MSKGFDIMSNNFKRLKINYHRMSVGAWPEVQASTTNQNRSKYITAADRLMANYHCADKTRVDKKQKMHGVTFTALLCFVNLDVSENVSFFR